MRVLIRDDVRPLPVILVHAQLQQAALHVAPHHLPAHARVLGPVDVVTDAILEQEDVRIVKVVDVVGHEIELFALDGRFVLFGPGARREEERRA